MSIAAIGIASLVASVVAGGVSAYGQYQQGKAAKKEGDYKAAVERNNALRAEYLAEDAIERGKESERRERLRGRMLLGQMRAALASTGQLIDEGSAGDLVIDQAATNELDAQTVRNNAAREAQDFRFRSGQSESQANLYQLAGENAQTESRYAAAGTLISTGSKVASRWYQIGK